MQQIQFTTAQIAQIKQQIWVDKIAITTIALQHDVDEQTIINAINTQEKTETIAQQLTAVDMDRIVEMGWEDRTPFDAIKTQFGISEAAVINIMRQQMKPSSFRMWRKRVTNRITKHSAKHAGEGTRFRCSLQKQITHNKISKR